MPSPGPSARRVLAFCRAPGILLLLVFCSLALQAQCPIQDEDDPNYVPRISTKLKKPADEEPMLPEAGFLSETHYTNQFFGFGFDLPLTVQGHEIMLPVMPETQHALLALQFEKEQHRGSIVVTAIDPKPGTEVNTPEQQEAELKSWAREGTEVGGMNEPFFTPDYMLRSGRFYVSVRHQGPNYVAKYWTRINNYVVKVVINTNDQEFLHKAKKAMSEARFYCPQEDGTLQTRKGTTLTVEGAPYEGPTVPTFRVNAAIRDDPAKNIPLGEVVDGVYSNPNAGLRYELPKGWQVVPVVKQEPPQDGRALREYQFVHACSETLLRAVPAGSVTDNNPKTPTPVIVLRAMDPNCLSMRTATTTRDKRVVDTVAATLEETSEFGQINTDELRTTSGHLFMVFRGTIATTPRGEELEQRMSQTIFATRYNKLVFVWSLMAPSTSGLAEIPPSHIVFDGTPPIQLGNSARK